MRNIYLHRPKLDIENGIEITAIDEAGAGGASRHYRIDVSDGSLDIEFQPNDCGVTNESLIAIVIDRLTGFQAGAFPCQENQLALERLEDALAYLHNREFRMAENAAVTVAANYEQNRDE